MEYKDYLEEAKKYIQKNNPDFALYEDYYNAAVKSVAENYGESENRINARYEKDKNAAAAQSAVNAKNIAAYMASRGLARSGEAQQETISSNLSLNQTLTDLASAKYDALSNLHAEKNSSLLDLEKEYAAKKSEKDDWLYRAAYDLAAAEYAYDARKEDQTREDADAASRREYEEYIRRLEYALKEDAAMKERDYEEKKTQRDRDYAESLKKEDRDYAEGLKKDDRDYEKERLEDERAYQKQLLEEKRAYDEGVKEKERELTLETAENGHFKPSQTPAALAKALLSAYVSDGKSVSSITDKVKIEAYLEELEEVGAPASYIKELVVSLKASGYSAPSEKEKRAFQNVKESESVYRARRDSYYQMYISLGLAEKRAAALAEGAAVNARLDYCYTHSGNALEFGHCCEILGVTEKELDAYLARVSALNADDKYAALRFDSAK